MENVDDTDIAILRALMRNARASYREIAHEIGVAVGTVQHRMQKLEKKGILTGFIPVIDYTQLGYGINAIIALHVPKEKNDELKKMLKENPNVNSIYHTTGDTDMFIRVKFKTAEELYNFLTKELADEYVKSSKTYTVLYKWREYGKLLKE
ncbi:MAG: Lrp/AsnC family transcriptional regulator [Candidatus Diapherotrites archaeon]|nr:Lrp/AsnC family transcriptional regulator [Candidatus Diapherotrites archaeon]